MRIGSLELADGLLLAPLDGFGDAPFRLLCRSMGAVLSYVPIVPDDAILARRRARRPLIAYYVGERPLGIQLLTRDPDRVVKAIARVLPLQPAVIDLNMGCPARKVVQGGRGAGLLREPELAAEVMAAAVGCSPVPVTAKIRLGWDDVTRNHVEVARLLEQAGAAAICVHGRTRSQAYQGRADWAAICEVRKAVSIPVIANGDIYDVASADAIVDSTGCAAAMAARGAIGNPWLFQRRDLFAVPLAERLGVLAKHLHMSVLHYGERRGVVSFRKHVVQYIKGLPGAAAVRTQLMHAQTAAALLTTLAEQMAPDDRARSALLGQDVTEIKQWMGELCA